MTIPTNREEFKNWCLRQLGFPVHSINIDDDQLDDCVDEALQYFQDFHFDAVERWYLKHQITDQDKINKYITIPNHIIGVTRIFPFESSSLTLNMFDYRYQMRLNDLQTFTSASYVNYAITQQHIRTLDMLFSGETPIRFNRHAGKLYIDWDWNKKVDSEEWIVIEGYIILDPSNYTKVWNDRLLKKLATAYAKRQWGNNMKKFQGVKLPGDIVMNGQQIYDEAVAEIKELEDEIRSSMEEPPMFKIG
jgi:hypothetical protein